MTAFAHESAHIIQQLRPNFTPKINIVLGSGLGSLAAEIEDSVIIPYEKLSGFHVPEVQGHAGRLHLGYLNSIPVSCMEGRAHYYEGVSDSVILTKVRTCKLIGCEIYLATNAAGSLNPEMKPGTLMVVKDHLNFQFRNPLLGPNDNNIGPRFVSLENAYDSTLREQLLQLGHQFNLPLHEGIYAAVLGPSFETPAEIRALRLMGADVVGMSTVPEVIAARHCGLNVAVISAITNMAVGISPETVTHALTLEGAAMAATHFKTLVLNFVAQLRG